MVDKFASSIAQGATETIIVPDRRTIKIETANEAIVSLDGSRSLRVEANRPVSLSGNGLGTGRRGSRWCGVLAGRPKPKLQASAKKPDPERHPRVGLFIDLDQSALTGPEHRSAMAGIDWTQVIGIAALVFSVAMICAVVFAI